MNESKIITTTNILSHIVAVYGSIQEPLFLAKDVAEWIGLTNVTNMISRVESSEVTKLNLGGLQGECNMLTEDGLYEVLMQSRKPTARQFKSMVKQYLKELRRHGATAVNPDDLLNPDFIIKLATELKAERAKTELLQARTEAQQYQLTLSAPKVSYFDEVLQSDALINTNVIAKELGMSAITLNRMLHKLGIIYLSGRTWVLYHKYQDQGYTGTKTATYTDSFGNSQTHIQTVWSEKGRNFIHETIKKNRA